MGESNYYYVGPNKKPVGPYTLIQLQRLASRGDIKSTTKVIRKGDKAWVPYSKLSTAIPPPPDPQLPPPSRVPNPSGSTFVKGVGNIPKGQFTPEMLTRLNRENAEEGEVEIALSWDTSDDLDLHCIDPSGFHICFAEKKSPTGGWLDVDMNVDGESLQPVEHIRWPKGQAPQGEYQISVELYTYRSSTPLPIPFTVGIKANNKFKNFETSVGKKKKHRLTHVHSFRVDDPQ